MSDIAKRIKQVVPYLRCKPAMAAIDFYTTVFGAREMFRLAEPGGRIGHAQLELGTTTLMLSDEYPEMGILSPLSVGGAGALLHLHVDDVDDFARRAIAAGATMLSEPADQFYGERSCKVRDPFGHEWMFAHTIESVSLEEIERRFSAMCKPGGAG